MNEKVLIVHPDTRLGDLLKQRLTRAGYEVVLGDSGRNLDAIIYELKPAVVLTEAEIPEASDYDLRLRLLSDTDGRSIARIAARVDDDTRRKYLNFNRENYIGRVYSLALLVQGIERLVSFAAASGAVYNQPECTGVLSDLTVFDLVQALEDGAKTGCLFIYDEAGEPAGEIRFREGRITNALAEPFTGTEAVYSLLEKTEGGYRFTETDADPAAEDIFESTRSLLMNGCRMLEGARRLDDLVSHPKTVYTLKTETPPPELKVSREALEAVSPMLAEGRSIQDILESGRLSRIHAAYALFRMAETGMITPDKKKAPSKPEREKEAIPLPEESLVNLLKDCERRNATGVCYLLKLSSPAAVYFENGRIIHAFYGKATGKKALFRIFSETGCEPEFQLGPIFVVRTIDEPLDMLLEEGEDEVSALNRLESSHFDVKLVSLNAGKLAENPAAADKPEWKNVLSLVQQFGRVRDVVEQSRITDLQTYKMLVSMVKKEIITMADAPDVNKP